MAVSYIDSGKGFNARDSAPLIRRVEGSFAPNGASAILAANNKGSEGSWSVAWTSTGLYTLTLLYGCTSVEKVTATLQAATALATFLQVGTITVTNGVAVIQLRATNNAGAVADIAADANNRINFDIVVRCTERKV